MSRAAAGGALAVVLLIAGPAFACTPSADFSVGTGSSKAAGTSASAPAGAAVPFEGNNWDAEGMPVKVLWNEAGSDSSRLLFAVAPDAAGKFRVTATIPADARPGFYTLRATQIQSNDRPKESKLAQGNFEVLEPGQQPTQQTDPQPTAEQQAPSPEAQAAPAPQPQATRPAAASPAAPAARRSVPARNAAAAPAPAPAAPVAVDAPAPVPAEQPTAPVAVADEPAAAPSVKTTASDLWSGFNGRSADQVPALAGPIQAAPAESMAGAIALLVVGTLTLLAGVGVATVRRTRARAQA